MPRMGVSEEIKKLCYKNRDTYDYEHDQPRNVCHHIDGDHDNNDPENLIWLSDWEHRSYHSSHRSAETLKKMAESQRGNKYHLGKKHTDETKLKMSKAKKGHKYSVGMCWFNNGSVNKRAKECPDGFVPGRINYKRVKKI